LYASKICAPSEAGRRGKLQTAAAVRALKAHKGDQRVGFGSDAGPLQVRLVVKVDLIQVAGNPDPYDRKVNTRRLT
jgi:hypothetical protein